MPVLTSVFNAQTEEAKANRQAWQRLIDDLHHQRRIAAPAHHPDPPVLVGRRYAGPTLRFPQANELAGPA